MWASSAISRWCGGAVACGTMGAHPIKRRVVTVRQEGAEGGEHPAGNPGVKKGVTPVTQPNKAWA